MNPDTVPLPIIKPQIVRMHFSIQRPTPQVNTEQQLAVPDRQGDIVHPVPGVEEEVVVLLEAVYPSSLAPTAKAWVVVAAAHTSARATAAGEGPAPGCLEVEGDLVQLGDYGLAAGLPEVVADVLSAVECGGGWGFF